MKVLIVADAPIPHTYMNYRGEPLAYYLSENGNKVSIICCDPLESTRNYIDAEFIYTRDSKSIEHAKDISSKFSLFLKTKQVVAQYLDNNSPDIVRPISFLPCLATKKTNIPIISNLNDFYSELYSQFNLPLSTLAKRIIRLAEKHTLRKSDVVIVDSPTQREQWERWGLDPKKSIVLPHGLPHYLLENQKLSRNQVRDQLDIKNDEKMVFYIGDISRLDGIDILISAAPSIIKWNPKIKFVIVGSGNLSYMRWLKTLVDSRQLSRNFNFIKRISHDQVLSYVKAADICIAPFRTTFTSNSSVANKVLEYISGEIPIICSKGRGVAEMLGDAIFYVEPENQESLVNGLRILLADDKTYEWYSSRIQQIKKFLSWKKIVEREQALFEAALDHTVEDYSDLDYIPSQLVD